MKLTKNKVKISVMATFSVVILLGFLTLLIAQVQKEKLNDQNKLVQAFELTTQLDEDNKTLKVGEQVLLILTIKNNSDEELFILESSTERDYKIEVKDEGGKIISLTDEGRRLTDPSAPVWRNFKSKVDPGKSKQSKINLAYLFDMSAKGKYFITAKRLAWKVDGTRLQSESNIIEVVVE